MEATSIMFLPYEKVWSNEKLVDHQVHIVELLIYHLSPQDAELMVRSREKKCTLSFFIRVQYSEICQGIVRFHLQYIIAHYAINTDVINAQHLSNQNNIANGNGKVRLILHSEKNLRFWEFIEVLVLKPIMLLSFRFNFLSYLYGRRFERP